MMQRRYWRHLDGWLLLFVAVIALYGLVVLASATRFELLNLLTLETWLEPRTYSHVQRQVIWLVLGATAILCCTLFDYRALARWANGLYLVSLGLLVMVLYVGQNTGTSRWIYLGGFQLQPSEFAKLALIVALATLLTRKERNEGRLGWLDVGLTFLYLAPMMVLVIRQPDLGTALVLLGILVGMLLMAGLPLLHLAALTLAGLTAGVGAILLRIYFDAPIPLQDYQLQRMIIFLNPASDPFGAGYHILQSQYAIGSGGVYGQGLFLGGQSGLDYLPERHTDFIFAVLGEELGFVGATVLILLFFLLLWRIFRVAALAKDQFGALLVAGVGSMLAFHVVVNVGMTLGLMPVTGLPLPLVSYGGSSLLAKALGLGLVLNVYM